MRWYVCGRGGLVAYGLTRHQCYEAVEQHNAHDEHKDDQQDGRKDRVVACLVELYLIATHHYSKQSHPRAAQKPSHVTEVCAVLKPLSHYNEGGEDHAGKPFAL